MDIKEQIKEILIQFYGTPYKRAIKAVEKLYQDNNYIQLQADDKGLVDIDLILKNSVVSAFKDGSEMNYRGVLTLVAKTQKALDDKEKAELEDLLGYVSEVYCELTNGKFSKPNTDKVYILSAVEESYKEIIKEEKAEAVKKYKELVDGYLIYTNSLVDCLKEITTLTGYEIKDHNTLREMKEYIEGLKQTLEELEEKK